ncbi:MAG: hypothetical protein NT027_14915 [Proteobacteria bacterium]|nr:hypothetical protein [Pseudomonadota bacterium]
MATLRGVFTMETMLRIKLFSRSQIFSVALLSALVVGCSEDPSFNENEIGKADDLLKDETPNADEDKVGDDHVSDESEQCEDDSDKDSASDDSENFDNLLLASQTSTINAQSNVDVLWIVDSSGSMSEEQSYLGQNFSAFMSNLIASGINFQTGVTSTDICSNTNPALLPANERYCPTLDGSTATRLRGSLVGSTGKKVLKPSMSDVLTRFTSYTDVGTNGSGYEHGLKAAEMAVSKSLQGQNEGLIRNNAFLAIIVVSDEEDDGIGLGKTDTYSGRNYVAEGLTSVRYTEDNLISYLSQAKGAGNYSISTITGTKNANGTMCSAPHSSPREEGSQYVAAARKTGGIVQSICDTNWSNSLARIGQDMTAQSAQIVLAHAAYDTSIKVYVSGVRNFDWTYSSGTRSIKFTTGKVPPNGSQIKVDYYYAP